MKICDTLHRLVRITLLIVWCSCPLAARDRAHFYATYPLWQEPRVEKNWLMSLDTWIYGGKAKKAHDLTSCCTPLLDIYGTQNMRSLGEGVPDKNLSTYQDLLLVLVDQIPACNKTFGYYSFNGRFKDVTADFMLTQNFTNGLFATLDIPIRSLCINSIIHTDLSPQAPIIPNNSNRLWNAFQVELPAILARYDLNLGSWKKSGVGDISLMLGWTRNDNSTKYLDFVDYTFQAGVLIPSGAQRNPNYVFSLPLGYDGHVGLPIMADLGLGLFDWLTFCLHFDATILFNATHTVRMKTSWVQSGFLKLAKGRATINSGCPLNLGFLAKADHVLKGFSAGLGYTFSYKAHDTLYPCDCEKFNSFVASSDEMYKEWSMHTIQLQLDYDLNHEDWVVGPRLGIVCDWYVGGKRSFITHTYGGTIGLDINFDF
jgi:hypothetical protein